MLKIDFENDEVLIKIDDFEIKTKDISMLRLVCEQLKCYSSKIQNNHFEYKLIIDILESAMSKLIRNQEGNSLKCLRNYE